MDFQVARDRFLAHVRSVSPSQRTLTTYAQCCNRVSDWLKENERDDFDVNAALEFVQSLSELKPRPARSTVLNRLACLSRLLHFLVREGLLEIGAQDLERFADESRRHRRGFHRKLPKTPDRDIIAQLLTTAQELEIEPCESKRETRRRELRKARDIAILESLRASGMRVSEVCSLSRGDLDSKNHTAVVMGKGNKPRVIFFDENSWKSIQSYLTLRGDDLSSRSLNALPVFSNHSKNTGGRLMHLSTESIERMFARLCAKAELKYHLTPHSLRHAFATQVLGKTGNLAAVQDMLGHSSPETTRIYAKLTDNQLKETYQAAFGT